MKRFLSMALVCVMITLFSVVPVFLYNQLYPNLSGGYAPDTNSFSRPDGNTSTDNGEYVPDSNPFKRISQDLSRHLDRIWRWVTWCKS